MTFFQRKIYRIVEKIPRGRVITYKAVVKLASSLRAWQAVGNILNKNRNPKIPCHRVIKSDGKIGGYKNGIEKKIALLKKEGIRIKNGRILINS